MKRIRLGGMTLAVLGAAWFLLPVMNAARHLCPLRPTVREAAAMPNWARRYGVNCSMCHTTVPHLTKVGYNFRRAGFRMPDEIGKEAKFANIGDLYSTRVREDYNISMTATKGDAANSKVPAHNEFVFNELTFYPISGAFGKYWASETELTFMPDLLPEVENGYARATYPVNENLFLTARAGIFHPFEGYGGSDRPVSNFRPMFQTTSAKDSVFGTGKTFDGRVVLFGQDQQGVEVGGTYKDTTLSLAILDGYNTTLDASDSAKRNTPGSALVRDDNNNKDFLLFFNQFIGEKAAVSAEYLNGRSNWALTATGLPNPSDTDTRFGNETGVPPAGTANWANDYQRLALYASYEALPNDKVDILYGYMIGHDHRPNPLNLSEHTDSFNSSGWYLEENTKWADYLTTAVRYDTFRPSYRTAGNRMSAITLTAAIPMDNVKFLLDYQLKRTQSFVGNDRTDNTLQAEWMVHF